MKSTILEPGRGERLAQWIAWRLPGQVVYWAAIRVIAHATMGRYAQQVAPDLLATEALERWSDR